ncbi:MAG: hypothetical protein II167_02235 [Clostridiales bacterium]|nr:hypothetical protein [Clostridiales bacterium]
MENQNNPNVNPQPQQAPYQQPVQQAPYQQPMQQAPYQQPMQQAPYQQPMMQAPAQPRPDQSKLFAILAYIPLFFLIGLLVAPEKFNPFVKNHVNNGILISILTAVSVLFRILFGLIAKGFGETLLVIFLPLTITLIIFGIEAVIKNQYYSIPFIGNKILIVK